MFSVYPSLIPKSIFILTNDSNRSCPLHWSGSEFTRASYLLNTTSVRGVASDRPLLFLRCLKRLTLVWGCLSSSLRVFAQTLYYVVAFRIGPGCRRNSMYTVRVPSPFFFPSSSSSFFFLTCCQLSSCFVWSFCEPMKERGTHYARCLLSVYANCDQFTDAASTLFHSV